MMKKDDDSDLKDTETLILRAAEQEFMAKGFAGARTTAIAEAAGVTHAMLHYYFRTKEKLFDRIVSEKIALLKDVFVHSVGDFSLSLEEIIRNIIERHLDFIASNPSLPRFVITELYGGTERAEMILDKVEAYAPMLFSSLQQKIDAAAANGQCRKVNARMLMLDIASLNIFPYLATPIVNAAMDNCMVDQAEFLAQRKRENYDTIMCKLRP